MAWVTVAAMTAMVAGTGLSMAGNAKAQSAVNAARAASMARQKELQAQAGQVFDQSANKSSVASTEANLSKGVGERANILARLRQQSMPAAEALPANGQPDYTITQNGQPENTARGRAGLAANAWSRAISDAAGRMGSYEDNAVTQNIQQQQAGNELGVIGSKSRGEANLLPIEMEAASHKGDALSGWGQIVSAIGQAGSMASAGGLFSSAAPTGGAAVNSAVKSAVTPLGGTYDNFMANVPYGLKM